MRYLLILSLLISSACSIAPKSTTTGKVIELVIWKPIEGQTEESVLQVAKDVNKFIEDQPGFISRDLSKNEKGEWLDFVYWDSMENAQRAAKAAQSSKLCQPFFSIIDMKSMKMYHFDSQFKHTR